MQLISTQLDAVAFKKAMHHLMQLGSPQTGNLLTQSAHLRENQVLLEALFLLSPGSRVPGLSCQAKQPTKLSHTHQGVAAGQPLSCLAGTPARPGFFRIGMLNCSSAISMTIS
jgi:hypothetical protein